MAEPEIRILNRRFVTTFYDAFGGSFGDPAARRFVEAAEAASGRSIQYGGFLTPDGELLVGFGYEAPAFQRAIRIALERGAASLTVPAEEEAILERARTAPDDPQALLAAGLLLGELWRFEEAERFLERAADRASGDLRARALYEIGHRYAVDIVRRKPDLVRAAFARIDPVPDSLADDVALDRISTSVRLAAGGAFFGGYEFAPGTDLPATIEALEGWIAARPDSNRIGQMHFYLGLARMESGDATGAAAAWRAHVERFPDDRFAMLSRIHDPAYVFSPYRTDGPVIVDPRGR